MSSTRNAQIDDSKQYPDAKLKLGVRATVQSLPTGTQITAGPHILILPKASGSLETHPLISQWWYDGIYLLIEEPGSNLVAFDQSGVRLWTIRPSDFTEFDCSDFSYVKAIEEDGAPQVYFGSSYGHIFRLTDLISGKFEYQGWTK